MTVKDKIEWEISPTSNSRCRKCKRIIQEGEVRIAIRLDWHGCSPRYICSDCLDELNWQVQQEIAERQIDVNKKLGGG